jgi:hypothetical protein
LGLAVRGLNGAARHVGIAVTKEWLDKVTEIVGRRTRNDQAKLWNNPFNTSTSTATKNLEFNMQYENEDVSLGEKCCGGLCCN